MYFCYKPTIMKNSTLTTLLALSLAIVSCKESSEENNKTSDSKATEASFQDAEWLIGNWGNTLPDGSFIEIWTKENDTVYKAESYFIANNDTLFAEYVSLGKVNDTITYTVTMPSQNNEQPVGFKLKSMSANKMVFENPQHDYPNKIVYNKITKDSIVAIISGAKKGKQASETFAMRRLK